MAPATGSRVRRRARRSSQGFDVLFDAWRGSRGSAWDVDLLVVGAGAEREAWKRRAAEAGLAERIRFLGFRPTSPRCCRRRRARASGALRGLRSRRARGDLPRAPGDRDARVPASPSATRRPRRLSCDPPRRGAVMRALQAWRAERPPGRRAGRLPQRLRGAIVGRHGGRHRRRSSRRRDGRVRRRRRCWVCGGARSRRCTSASSTCQRTRRRIRSSPPIPARGRDPALRAADSPNRRRCRRSRATSIACTTSAGRDDWIAREIDAAYKD